MNRIVGKLCTAEMLDITDTVSLALKEDAVKILKNVLMTQDYFIGLNSFLVSSPRLDIQIGFSVFFTQKGGMWRVSKERRTQESK